MAMMVMMMMMRMRMMVRMMAIFSFKVVEESLREVIEEEEERGVRRG